VRVRAACTLILSLAALAAFGQAAARAASDAPSAAARDEPKVQEGVASWYGPGFHGKRTASGEIYDKEGLTAAHRTLPFGTYLLVRSLDNGSSVVVRVNDRGPFAKGRALDLSEAAARMLGMIASGTARVSFEAIPESEALAWTGGSPDGSPPRPARAPASSVPSARAEAPARVRIQVASYSSVSNANATVRRLALSGIDSTIERAGAFSRVVIADLSLEQSREVTQKLDALGYRGYTVTTIR